MLSTKREETPKDHTRKIAFNNFFGSPEPEKASMLATMTSLSNLSKKNSTKAIQIMSPSKKVAPNASGFINTSTSQTNTGNVSTNMNAEKLHKESEKQIYMSYDFAHSKVVKKPAFKLDLSKRSNNGHA
jgi:phage terminase large subunit-like protein